VLALVQSLVKRTAAESKSADAMREKLEGRIEALARTQALLTRTVGQGVDLEHLVRQELTAQAANANRVSMSGQPVRLPSKMAEVLTLAIHELATNAVKHGALGDPGGRLSVHWRTEHKDGARWLRLAWEETGLRLDLASPLRRGFGLELITRRVPYELDGEGRVDLKADGLQCAIDVPLQDGMSILETGGPAAPSHR
jgi:two-component sensor histidine kinase